MSDLARTFAKSKLAALPPEPPLQEEYEDDSSSASSMDSVGTIVPRSSQRPSVAPAQWQDFFTSEYYLEQNLDNDQRAKYHVFVVAPAGPDAPVFVCHHGAGSSGMSFALFVKELRQLLPKAGILVTEAREHGSTVWNSDGTVNKDLSVSLLSQDMANMINLTKDKLGWKDLPNLVLVGHSLGGAVVTEAAKSGILGTKVLGYAVLDVVEGSAMDALKSMQSYLATRPSKFDSVEQAIEWHVRSRTLRNITSARASVPPLFIRSDSGALIWKTDLSQTEAYWENWFTGMSSKFLGAKGAKLLILAGTDRLDKELMIGQMQGKFQLSVFPEAGHFLQEDQPKKTAEVVAEFFRRNDRSALVLPPKVGDLLKMGKKV